MAPFVHALRYGVAVALALLYACGPSDSDAGNPRNRGEARALMHVLSELEVEARLWGDGVGPAILERRREMWEKIERGGEFPTSELVALSREANAVDGLLWVIHSTRVLAVPLALSRSDDSRELRGALRQLLLTLDATRQVAADYLGDEHLARMRRAYVAIESLLESLERKR
ncbi:MAG: hypothetical protein IPM29_15025 [Planctomycetes bacterium]|nr:hypothetical protein [Planctomycetota bacterium]